MATRVGRGRLTETIYLLHPQNLLLDARISQISRTYLFSDYLFTSVVCYILAMIIFMHTKAV